MKFYFHPDAETEFDEAELRLELLIILHSLFEFQSRKTIDALWAQEAEDRIDAFERGEISVG